MQKVESSSLFSRLIENPRISGGLSFGMGETQRLSPSALPPGATKLGDATPTIDYNEAKRTVRFRTRSSPLRLTDLRSRVNLLPGGVVSGLRVRGILGGVVVPEPPDHLRPGRPRTCSASAQPHERPSAWHAASRVVEWARLTLNSELARG